MSSKIDQLCEVEGVSREGYLETWALDSVVPGICMNADCDYTTSVEPDQDRGWCENCQSNTVKSGLILMAVM